MWQLIVLFIVLTPGVLFTIPPLGKNLFGVLSGKVLTAILHGILFAAVARFFVLYNEGFQWHPLYVSCGNGMGAIYGASGWGTQCVQCPVGSFRVESRGHARPSHICSQRCGRGEQLNFPYNACMNCPTGSVSQGNDSDCTPCPPNTAPSPSKNRCIPPSQCPNGMILASGGNVCTTCTRGKRPNNTKTLCI